MATKTRQQLSAEIIDLCEQAGCSDKIQKIHHAQYVDRKWNPHPPQRFVNWWGAEGWKRTEKKTDRAWSVNDMPIDCVRAFNSEAVREVYQEAKQIGAI